MKKRRQDDPELVRREYADDARLAARQSVWARRTGPKVFDVAFEAVLESAPRRVLEVGCGRGEFAARLQAARLEVVATDQSAHMVGLAAARGLDARVADVRDLPFADGEFDVAVSNFMLYHVADIDRGLAELARVAPRLVAATNGVDQLREMWDIVGRDLGDRRTVFMRETGEALLRAHYDDVRMVDLPATVEMTADDMRHYVANSVAHRDLADRVPDFVGTRTVRASTAIFVASSAA
jgi:SAM-dependent methyltransferase